MYSIPVNSESINSDSSVIQWKPLKSYDSIDNMKFSVVQPNGKDSLSGW